MTKQKKIEQLEYILIRDNYTCRACHQSVHDKRPQRAHIIGDRKINLRRYNDEIVNWLDNLALTCSIECNKYYDIGDMEYWQKRIIQILRSFDTEENKKSEIDKVVVEKKGKYPRRKI